MTALDLAAYQIDRADGILTPALLVYPDYVESNIAATLRLLHGDANRWRPHLKTAKMPWVIRRLIEHGVTHFKCATTRELLVACECGAEDVLVAYSMVGANARRVMEIAHAFPETRVSVLIESPAQAAAWIGHHIGLFIDVNPGMDRTGIGADRVEEITSIARAAGEQFRGLHYYDGHVSAPEHAERARHAHAGYDHLMSVVQALQQSGVFMGELITSGTPAFPYALTYSAFNAAENSFVHRVSPGTIVFSDMTSLGQLPEEFGYRPAALVLATVVSHPGKHRVTCNAGHKSVSADAGVPTCLVIGHPELQAAKPSEEHLPFDVAPGAPIPAIGDLLYLLPRHVCPTVNNFDEALMVADGRVTGIEPIAARGHERALASKSSFIP